MNDIFTSFCKYVDETIFSKENSGEDIAFIVDQAFIDDFCKKSEISEKQLLNEVRWNLRKSASYGHLHVKGILAIQLYAATKREDSGGITEKNYRDRLSQVLGWDLQDLQSWMAENQEDYWSTLYSWCDRNDFPIAKCHPKTGAGRYVQYPVQQAARVFTQKDLKSIAYHFVKYKLQPNEDISEPDFWRILNKRRLPSYVHTNHGQRLVEVREYLDDAYRQIYNFYLRWDGSYLDYERNRTSRVDSEQHFLYLSEDGHIDIRDKNMKLEKQLDWLDLSINEISRFYSFKRSQWILFRRNEDYSDYWEETRYLEKHEENDSTIYDEGMAVVFSNAPSVYSNLERNPFSNFSPIFSNSRVKIYRFSYSILIDHIYTEKKFFRLDGGLKVGRMQYMLGGAPVLAMDKDSRFWIDGETPSSKPVNGRLSLNYLPVGTHDIKFPGFKKVEFTIVKPDITVPSWGDSYNKWVFDRKKTTWKAMQSEDGVVGIDFSTFKMDTGHAASGSVLTRWATYHTTGRTLPDEDNIALKILTKQDI